MKYVRYQYVDAITGQPFDASTSRGGPVAPEDTVFGFALESQYPTNSPTFYGKTDGATDLPGIISVITKAEYDAAKKAEDDARILKLIPMEVTAAQAQVALYNAGLLEAVEDKIANHPYPPIRIWFRSARNWRRQSLCNGYGR